MSKPNRKKIKLETLRAQRAEATGAKELEVELGDDTFVFPMLNWLPMAAYKLLQAVDQSDLVGQVEILIGKEQTARLLDLGVTIGDFSDIMGQLQKDAGVSPGESTSSSE
jgi:hypothetical protein